MSPPPLRPAFTTAASTQEETMQRRIHVVILAVSDLDRALSMNKESHVCHC
jgi:hypothetical protein